MNFLGFLFFLCWDTYSIFELVIVYNVHLVISNCSQRPGPLQNALPLIHSSSMSTCLEPSISQQRHRPPRLARVATAVATETEPKLEQDPIEDACQSPSVPRTLVTRAFARRMSSCDRASGRRPLSARRPRAAKVRGTALHHLHGSR